MSFSGVMICHGDKKTTFAQSLKAHKLYCRNISAWKAVFLKHLLFATATYEMLEEVNIQSKPIQAFLCSYNFSCHFSHPGNIQVEFHMEESGFLAYYLFNYN